MLKSKSLSRRNLLLTGAALAASGGYYAAHRGLRFPRFGLEHPAYSPELNFNSLSLNVQHAIYLRPAPVTGDTLALRAIAPEPTLSIKATNASRLNIDFKNISPSAALIVDSDKSSLTTKPQVHETINGINRRIEINLRADQNITLSWRLSNQEGLKFAVIGDSGADLELDWCLQRAQELDAKFLLHLGDFNYAKGEYDLAIQKFNTSPLPCYISIGNHDYNDSGLIYQQFLDQLGPMNQAFTFADCRFINFDSAADFLPANSGNRGALFESLFDDKAPYTDQVLFTHRPLEEPRQNTTHAIGDNQLKWLHESLHKLGCDSLLTGHVHLSTERDVQGIKQLTAGEGLGYEDILKQRQVSQLLIGQLEKGKKINYQWHALNMPWSAHQSPTHTIKLLRDKLPDTLDWYNKLKNNA